MTTLSEFRGRWFVVKLGGELAQDVGRLSRTVGAAVRAFLDAGIKVCVVHGGGPQATELSKRLGLDTKQVAGQRVTDEATLEVMKMTLAGQVSVNVASALRLAGVPALCTTGVSAGLVDATRRPKVAVEGVPEPVDYGLVGDVAAVNVALLETLAERGVVVALGSLAGDAGGRVFNVNADTVAAQLAGTLRAARLLLVSNVPGVLRDRSDAATRIPRLTPSEAKAQVAAGVIQGGMIPKVEESLAMLDAGIDAIHIVGASPESAILDEALSPGSRGTVFVKD
ncbi:MAG: acetylglutamate kinase [Myxococcaceae bacterium]|nr:acetylglutamate kinase [Myxococcaceae bacterium]MCA3010867.1 acetylglutamate kinase [Myxococcaceae bacterium]